MKRKTQKDKIEDYLKAGNSITPLDALEMFGCFRLGAHIFILRGEGLNIRTDFVTNRYKTKFAKYTLEQAQQPSLF